MDVSDGLPREITEIDTGGGGPGYFVDLDGRPGKEFETTDGIFTDASFSGEPPPVTLRFRDGTYGIDTDLMRGPPLDAAELAATAATLRHDSAWQHHGEHGAVPEDLWPAMARLIYTGHADQAVQLFDMAWPEAMAGKEDFLSKFYRCRLRNSRYWPAIAAMNDLPADPPEGECGY